MNIQRLNKLADLLEIDAANSGGIRFDMKLWGEVSDINNPWSCGTHACAMGLAALSGAFKSAGLRYSIDPLEPGKRKSMRIYTRKSTSAIDSASEIFSLDTNDAIWLFSPGKGGDYKYNKGKRSELEVAARIRYLIAS